MLTKAANRYAEALGQGSQFSHIQYGTEFEKTPLDRVLHIGGIKATTAENLAKIAVLQIPVVKTTVIAVDHSKIEYRMPNQKSLIPHHTIETASDAVVQSWMDSQGHRENLLYPTMTHIGCGVSFMYPQKNVPMIIAVQLLQVQ